jgi:hypothetical protein
VSVKTVEQHGIMVLHRVRLILIRQRTQFSDAVRSHLAEFGIVSAIGRVGLDRFLTIAADTDAGDRWPIVPPSAYIEPGSNRAAIINEFIARFDGP